MNKFCRLMLFLLMCSNGTHAQVNHYDRPADAVFINTYSEMDISDIIIYQSTIHKANFNYLIEMIEFVDDLLNNNTLDSQLRVELLDISKGMDAIRYEVLNNGKKLFSNVTEILVGINKDINSVIDYYNLRQKEKEEIVRRELERERLLEELKQQRWSGTGFALGQEYVITNSHVVEDAKNITVQGVCGNFARKYNAKIVIVDKMYDIAILKIVDSDFKGFGKIPYRIKTEIADVGEDIFVLGYPLISTMGDEIKLTTGIISSQTGYQGLKSLYQISAPVQPGNSGGPLFNKQGNLIGIVSAKHKDTENVGYAVKTSYLKNLLERVTPLVVLSNSNQLLGTTLTEKVKRLKNFVYVINCSKQQHASNIIKGTSHDIDISNPCISIPPRCKAIKIKRVQITLAQTIIDVEYDNYVKQVGWVSIDRETYIVSYNTGKKYKMVKAIGIPIYPQQHYFNSKYEKINFRLIFPSLPKNTTKFNLVEKGTSTGNVYGIILRK